MTAVLGYYYNVIKQWKAYGYPCLILQEPKLLFYTAYVDVSGKHPAYLKLYQQLSNIKVHGGLTFSGYALNQMGYKQFFVWRFGFDFCHAGDYVPNIPYLPVNMVFHEWTVDEVKKQTERLAEQLFDMEAKYDME